MLDKNVFAENGIIELRGYLPKKLTTNARDYIIEELKRLKFLVGGKPVSSKLDHLPVFQQTGHLGQVVKPGIEIERLFTPELISDMQTLADSKLKSSPRPQLLLSLPHKEEWSLDKLNWHLDLKSKDGNSPGVQAFILIDDLQAKGGATLALPGSHHPGYVRGPQPKFVEMSGRAGDVFLMDLRVLHSPSVNTTKKIRMMATNRFIR